jgi:hypothetical protein
MLSPCKLYCYDSQHDNDKIDKLNVVIFEYVYKCSTPLYKFLLDYKTNIYIIF